MVGNACLCWQRSHTRTAHMQLKLSNQQLQTLHKVLHDALPVLCDDALGVELHALHVWVLFMAHTHDGPIFRPGSDLEVLWDVVSLDHQTVVAACHERAATHKERIPEVSVV